MSSDSSELSIVRAVGLFCHNLTLDLRLQPLDQIEDKNLKNIYNVKQNQGQNPVHLNLAVNITRNRYLS